MQSEGRVPEVKRRWTRKGTRSCWECKRRKIRCTYALPTDAVCIGCARRCTKCVSQEFPDQASSATARSRLVGDRIGRVEAMVKELVKNTAGGSSTSISPAPNPSHSTPSEDATSSYGMPTPATCDTQISNTAPSTYSSVDNLPLRCFYETGADEPLSSTPPNAPETAAQDESTKFERLSEALLRAYPPRKDVEIIVKSCGKISTYFYQVLGRPYAELEDNAQSELDKLAIEYTPKTHPVLIARQMLKLSAMLQYNNEDTQPRLKELSESPRVIMKRLAETASRLVVADDNMVGTIEGLECILLEGMRQGNNGNLRRSWLTWRRAIGVAQLMCLQRPNRPPLESLDPTSSLNPQFLWYRIVYVDRFISLMLAMPQASNDRSMISEAALSQDTLMGQFERRLCVVASKILDRNERDPNSDCLADTQEIDTDLQKIAATMPSKWWLPPNLAIVQNLAEQGDVNLFMEMNRLFNHIYYYNLLNQLHLPYMLHMAPGPDQWRYEYSRITCVNASRDLLSRYILFRSVNRVAFCCRVIDFFALMATLTLLLAHMHSRRTCKNSANVLVHQRLSDRAMMDQVLENMETLRSINEDILSSKSASLLRQLLAIEADAAQGSGCGPGERTSNVGSADKLQVWVPYLGTVSITRDGEIMKEADQAQPLGYGSGSLVPKRTQQHNQNTPWRDQPGVGVLPLCQEGGGNGDPCATNLGPDQSEQQSVPPLRGKEATEAHRTAPVFPGPLSHDSLAPQLLYPGVTASADQWAFQGVDSTFFDTLMRDTSNQSDTSGGNWWSWSNSAGT